MSSPKGGMSPISKPGSPTSNNPLESSSPAASRENVSKREPRDSKTSPAASRENVSKREPRDSKTSSTSSVPHYGRQISGSSSHRAPSSPSTPKGTSSPTTKRSSTPRSPSSPTGIKPRSPIMSAAKRQLYREESYRSRTDSNPGSMRPRTFSTSSRRASLRRRSSLSLYHTDSIQLPLVVEPEEITIDKSKVPWWTSKRLCLSGICFIGFFCLYAQRVNLSVAIVCMVDPIELPDEDVSNVTSIIYSDGIIPLNRTGGNGSYEVMGDVHILDHNVTGKKVCPAPMWSGDDKSKIKGTFRWNKQLQGLILGAFFWGYTIMQIPSGWLSERYGPRKVISVGMFAVSILTILTPLFAKASPYLLLVARVLIGVGEAVMYPGAQALWAMWSPPDERSRLVGFAFGGSQLGNALAFPIAGMLCDSGFDGGWPSVFYVIGGFSFLWCILFVTMARNTPREMPGITEVERDYIEQSLGIRHDDNDAKKDKRKASKPWISIITSRPVWAILIANACGNYGAYMLLTQMPTYMKEVLHFDIKSNGVFSMIPYLVFWIFVIIAGNFADFFISREILSMGWTRKMCCTIGTVIPGIFLILTGYMDCWRQSEAVVLLTLSMAFCGFQFASYFINHGDIAPRYAGTVFGITNTGASVPGILAPFIVGAITPNKTQEEWLVAFYIAAVVYFCGAVFYLIFAEGEIQEWAKTEEDKKEEMEEDEQMFPLRERKITGISEDDELAAEDEVFNPNSTANHVGNAEKA